jgi:hypothetical protein
MEAKLHSIENQAVSTNGKVKFNKWLVTTTLTLLLTTIGILLEHIGRAT